MITGMPRIAIAVDDFDAAISTFRDELGLPVVDISATTAGQLGAKVAMCVPPGGSNIELMAPANRDAPLARSLTRFLDRRGQGLFALMLEAADPAAEAEVLSRRGLNVLPLMPGAGGRDVHPKATHGVLIRVYPTDSFKASDHRPESGRAPGLSGIRRVIVAVGDLAHAAYVYGTQLGLPVDEPVTDTRRGLATLTCRPPTGGVIELTSVIDANRPAATAVAEHIAERGEGLYALVLGDRSASAGSTRERTWLGARLQIEGA